MNDLNKTNEAKEQSENQSEKKEMIDGILKDMFSRYNDTFTELAKGAGEPNIFEKKEDL